MKPLLVLIGLLLAACGSAPQSHFGPVMDRATLIDALRTRVAVDITGTLAQPFLHPQSGTTVRLSGGGLAGPADAQLFGNDPGVVSLLSSLLGSQFAGVI